MHSIKCHCVKSYEYIIGSHPEDYCQGHPNYKPGNSIFNNSLAESEMNRVAEERKTGTSVLTIETHPLAVEVMDE